MKIGPLRISEALASWNVRSAKDEQLATPLLCGGLAALGFALGSKRALLALPAGATVAAAIGIRARAHAREGQQRERVIERATELAELGRKLVIYERETGLLAYWFVALRGDEECARAARYGEPLTVLVAECAPQNRQNVQSAARGLTAALRGVDIVSYVGNARFIALLPNTSLEMAASISARLQGVGIDHVGAAAFGEDCRTFDALYRKAVTRLAVIDDPPETSADYRIAA